MVRTKGASNVSEEQKQRILDLTAIGVKQKTIVEYYGMKQSTVANIVRRERNNNESLQRGRKLKLSERAQRALLKLVRENRFKPLHYITAEFNKFSPCTVSVKTVKRYLHRHGIRNYVAVSKPFLSKNNVCRRKQWDANHAKWCNEQWDRVVFSDESSFTVRPTTLRNRVWRKPSTRHHLNNAVHTFKSGYVSISVWAAFSVHGRTPLVRIEGTLKKSQYCNILQNHLLPFAAKYYSTPTDVIFQQDNCGPHKAKTVRQFLDATKCP